MLWIALVLYICGCLAFRAAERSVWEQVLWPLIVVLSVASVIIAMTVHKLAAAMSFRNQVRQ
jgi:hypothetical protein